MGNREYLVKVLNSYIDYLVHVLSLSERYQDDLRYKTNQIISKKTSILLLIRERDVVLDNYDLDKLKKEYKELD